MNKNSCLTIFGVALLTTMVTGLGTGSFMSPITSVFATTNQTGLQSVDGYLEECITELESDNANTEDALDQCQLADEELDKILANTTG
ncbi:MAG: hypothetical protein H0X03_08690 [Nitrosopumilus sp.]|nr:hypothetical protein [Nitrosopumilus sp.]